MKIIHCGLPILRNSASHTEAALTGSIKSKHDEHQAQNDKDRLRIKADVSEEEEESDSSDEDFYSVEDGVEDSEDEDDMQDQTDSDWEAREKERQRVLEAAGLIVNHDVKPPPRLERARSARQRRPPPLAPQRSSVASNTSIKDLPPVPERDHSPVDSITRLDDAFDRYEAFKQMQGVSNRLSVASSFETAASTAPESPVVSLAPSTSQNGEHRTYSHLLNFLGRRAPSNDNHERKTLTISSPILNRSESPSRENSPAFGSVSSFFGHFTNLFNSPFSHGLAWWTRRYSRSYRRKNDVGKR